MVVVLVHGASAQDPNVIIDGRVLWLAGEAMVVAPFVSGVFPVKIDLSQADQDEYMRLTAGDPVTVIGTIGPEGDRVMARSIRRR